MKLLFASLLTIACLSGVNAQSGTAAPIPVVTTPNPGATPAAPAPTVTPVPSPLVKATPNLNLVTSPTPISSPATPQSEVNSAGKGSTTIGNTYAPTNAEGKVVPRNP